MTRQAAATHAALEGCVGQHIRPAPDPEELGWQWPLGKPRIADHTCWKCSPLSYEFGSLGGWFVIVRTDRRQFASCGDRVLHTPPVRRVVAADWWQMILYGRAV